MDNLWVEQGFKINDHGSLQGKCHSCSNYDAIIINDLIKCKSCFAEFTKVDWLVKTSKYDEDEAISMINFYAALGNDKEAFNPNKIAERLALSNKIIYINNNFYLYSNGVYNQVDDYLLDRLTKNILGPKFKISYAKEVRNSLAIESWISDLRVNSNKEVINFRNGFLNTKTMEMADHSPDIISTIQLGFNYDPDAECPLWKNTLKEIFFDDESKVTMLQEFFGYCLINDNRFQTALFNIGEGANGKSLVLNTLTNILGPQNVTSIQLDNLSNRHYLANLYGKLVNVSIESEAKGVINDSMFKAITAGDPITVDEKYGKPFSFRPQCRMLFAMNELPRVEDKTDAFYRRLIILRYARKFRPEEQDRNLEMKLKIEYPGIINWMLYGMKRLYARGYFDQNNRANADEIQKYRFENNNVMVHAAECLEFREGAWLTYNELYNNYKTFCANNSMRPLSAIKYNKEFRKQNPLCTDAKDVDGRARIFRNVSIRII